MYFPDRGCVRTIRTLNVYDTAFQLAKLLAIDNFFDILLCFYVLCTSSTQQCYSFIYSLFHTEIFECAKITKWSHTKFCNFAVIEGNQMPLVCEQLINL